MAKKMNIVFSALVVLIFAMISNSALASQGNGSSLYAGCVLAAQARTQYRDISPNEISDLSFCLGTMLAVGNLGRLFGACLPTEATSTQLVKIVVLYMDEHPEFMHEALSNIGVRALRSTWPCKNK